MLESIASHLVDLVNERNLSHFVELVESRLATRKDESFMTIQGKYYSTYMLHAFYFPGALLMGKSHYFIDVTSVRKRNNLPLK